MVVFNLILPFLAALASMISNRRLSQTLIAIISVALIVNNIQLLHHPDSLVLMNFLGKEIALTTEPLANIFALMVSILYCATNFYSFFYLAAQEESTLGHDLHPKIHFFFMPIAIMSSLAVGYAANLMTLFLFYELLTLSTYPLVIQSFSESSRKAGRFYFTLLFSTSTFFILLAIIFIDKNYGDAAFKLGGIIPAHAALKDVLLLLICFIFGFSKTAIFPLFGWLPKAMAAPAPVSALLHAVAVVKTGIFALIKVFVYLFGIDYLHNISQISPWTLNWITILACFTIIFAGTMALRQDTIKKLLAYSTVSQLSYIILSLSFVSHKAVIAAFMQMLAHSVAKITLFFVAGIVYVSMHKTKINEMEKTFKALPIPVLLFIFAASSIIGLPLSVGYVTLGNIHDVIHDNMVAVFCLALSSLFSCYYFAKVIYNMLKPSSLTEAVCYRSVSALSWVSAITFSLSLLIIYYFDDLVAYISRGIWVH